MTLDHHLPRRPTVSRFVVAILLAGGFFAVSRPAHALEEFPGIIQDTYKETLTCPPPCTICHTSPSGGSTTATQPFVVNLTFPASATEETLPALLEALEKNVCLNTEDPGCQPDVNGTCTGVCDANGDGTGDAAQLKQGSNPNTGDKFFCVTYGCGAHVAPAPARRNLDGTAVLAALGALFVVGRRWRKSAS